MCRRPFGQYVRTRPSGTAAGETARAGVEGLDTAASARTRPRRLTRAITSASRDGAGRAAEAAGDVRRRRGDVVVVDAVRKIRRRAGVAVAAVEIRRRGAR